MQPPAPSTLARHGLSLSQWQELWDRQRGLCAVCQKPPRTRLVIDHDHRAARAGLPAVRGLCCPWCNGLLGKVRDNAAWCRAAADYLDRGATVTVPYPVPKRRPRKRRPRECPGNSGP